MGYDRAVLRFAPDLPRYHFISRTCLLITLAIIRKQNAHVYKTIFFTLDIFIQRKQTWQVFLKRLQVRVCNENDSRLSNHSLIRQFAIVESGGL